MISSGRTASNRRLFSEEDLARLMLLKKCIDQGYRIGAIFELGDNELRRLLDRSSAGEAERFSEILNRIEALDKEAVDKILVDRFLLLGPSAFAIDYVAPLMKTVGELWQAGDLTIASEHLISSAIRSLLGSALKSTRGREVAMTAVFCTPEGDIHEIGTLIAALLAQESGIEVIYFGAQLPISEICNAARRAGAQAVCVGSSWLGGPELATWTKDLRALLPANIEIWVGGAGFASVQSELPARTRMFYSLEDLESFLQVQVALPRAAQ